MIRKTALAILLATPFIAFASEHAKPKADIARGKVLAETICVACHGADGNSPASTNPHLAGQVEEYLYKQLSNFKPGDNKPALRNNPIMGGMAKQFSNAELKEL
ncbi:MAG TPA: c-type cytochrome, partial [Rhodocyclaceae bacterium]|nr:c-type cytochrome [Rhodocyclaceae bacterium]